MVKSHPTASLWPRSASCPVPTCAFIFFGSMFERDRPLSFLRGTPAPWRPRHWRSPGGATLEAGDGEPSAPIAEVEAALQRRGWRLLFPAALERAYHRETGVGRLTRIVLCNVAGALMMLANTARDSRMLPMLEPTLTPLRWGTAAFIISAAALMFWRRRTTAAWVMETVTGIGSGLVAVYVLIAAQYPIDDISVLIRMGAVSLLFMHAGLAARQQFCYTLGQGLLLLLGYAVLAQSHNDEQAVVVAGNVLLLATTLAFSLVANYVLEARERRAYLLRTLEHHQRQALAETTHTLRWLSLTDGLTGLANRRHFEAELQAAWQAATRDEPLALLQLDVDFFKRYNDRYGHPAGDVCLQQVAKALLGVAARHGGLAARTGGEEFALLLPAHSMESAVQVGEAVRLDVHALGLVHADSAAAPVLTVSIGAAAGSPSTFRGTRELIQAADQALYAAKDAGRDRVMRAAVDADVTSATASPPETAVVDVTAIESDPAESTESSIALTQRIDTLSGELDSKRLRWLKFAPALEAVFVQGRDGPRAVLLSTLGVLGALYCLFYIWLGRPLFSDVADLALQGSVWSTGVAVLCTASTRFRMAPWLRESIFAATAVGLVVSTVVLVAPSQKLTVYSYALSLFLIPTFLAVVAGQPFRLSLLASVLIWGTVVIGLRPRSEAAHAVWIESSIVVFDGIAFALIGGYLLELSTRRDYLLNALAAAQRELLGHHTDRLRGLAATDPLTGLANRRSFDEQHAALWASSAVEDRPLALLIVDVDHFKRYNDSQGHPAGDQCLRRIAQALVACSAHDNLPASTPWVARLGGEEFGFLLPGHDLASALAFGRGLCARIRALGIDHPDSPTAAWVTVSIGVASVQPAPGTPAGALLHMADEALYQAKAHGRNRAESSASS